MASPEVVIGVGVGTGSARAGIFALDGSLLGKGERSIGLWRSGADFVEQSSADIWAAVIAAVAETKQEAVACTIRGIGLDATCSLVVLGEAGQPLSVAEEDAAGGGGPRRHRLEGPSRENGGSRNQRDAATRYSAISAGASRPRCRRRSCSGFPASDPRHSRAPAIFSICPTS